MTSTQIATASKVSLIQYIAELQENETRLKGDVQNAVNIANYFSAVLGQIEKTFNDAPFINKEGNFIKNVFWVMTNLSSLINVIKTVLNLIKDWRKQVNILIENNQKQTEAAPEPAE